MLQIMLIPPVRQKTDSQPTDAIRKPQIGIVIAAPSEEAKKVLTEKKKKKLILLFSKLWFN